VGVDVAVVIVTGGAGFIGSHTIEALAARGYEVVVVDNLYSSSSDGLKAVIESGAKFLFGDVSDWRDLARLLEAVRPGDIAGIIHLAAIVGVMEVARDPWRGLDVNVRGTLGVLELARRLDAERVVFASSAAVYGEPRYLPVDEEHPLEPASLYGETKLMAERLLWRYAREYGLKPVALRYFNVYGPRMRPGPYAGVIHALLSRLLAGQPPIIHGDGEQTRDFIYVADVAEANLKALESGYVGAVNIGAGVETSINQLYKTLCRILGRDCPAPLHTPPRPGDVRRSRAAIGKAMETLGWRPRTSLEEGLAKTLEYYLSRGAAPS
jgi:UDP-glucose 4-epimerase